MVYEKLPTPVSKVFPKGKLARTGPPVSADKRFKPYPSQSAAKVGARDGGAGVNVTCDEPSETTMLPEVIFMAVMSYATEAAAIHVALEWAMANYHSRQRNGSLH